jgi:hypothetical protein
MAYSGSTAASSVSNPPVCIDRTLGAGARLGTTTTPMALGFWMFGTTEASSNAFTANYISDAYYIGMKQGDVVCIVGQTSTVASSQTLTFGVVGAVSTAGTQLSTFSFISST